MIASVKILLTIFVIQMLILDFDTVKAAKKKPKASKKGKPTAAPPIEAAATGQPDDLAIVTHQPENPSQAPPVDDLAIVTQKPPEDLATQKAENPATEKPATEAPAKGRVASPPKRKPEKKPSESSAPAAPRNNTDPDEDPSPDPFDKHPKWSILIHRLDAITQKVREMTKPLGTLISDNSLAGNQEGFITFAKGFHAEFKKLNDFFTPLHEELADGAAYTVVNPAIGLTDLKTLNEWGQQFASKSRLDQSKLKWIEVNGQAITVHYIFDRLHKELEKWGLSEVDGSVNTDYPSWFHDISTHDDASKPTYELRQLAKLTGGIDAEIIPDGQDKHHMMRSLEKILRRHLSGWDPDSDYNIYCYGNNQYGVIHDVFDLLTDAAMYLSLGDVKDAILRSTYLLFESWKAQSGGGEDGDVKNGKPAEDFSEAINKIFDEMKARIDKKVRLAGIEILGKVDIVPGPTTFKCDKPPMDTGKDPSPNQPEGHNEPSLPKIPPRLPPGGPTPVYPESQWGKDKPKELSPIPQGPHTPLDPQSGLSNPPEDPVGYTDHRKPTFEFASFSQAYLGYLEAETILNPDGSCKSTCLDFKRPTPTCDEKNKTGVDCQAYRNAYCEEGKDCMAKSACKEDARKCIRTSFNVEFCPSKDGEKKTERIYDWIDINGTLVGKVDDDENRDCKTEVMKVRERWEMDFGVILNAPQYCEVCLCVCDGPMTDAGIHFFDIQPVVAEAGHVVTSIRFGQKDNVMRLEIEQAKLDENGKVDASTAQWVNSPEADAKDPAKTARLGPHGGFRQISLDQVHGTTTEVITGVKFTQKGDTLHLSAQLSKVDSSTGALTEGSEWKEGNYPEPEPVRKKINLDDKINPLKQKGPSQPYNIGENKRSIRFDASSLPLDAGQSVVPFFDIQAVRHHTVRKPLNAIGILFKAKRGSGGYLSPTVTPFKKFFI